MAGKMYTIDEIKQLVAPIAQQYGIERAYLFGSYARGEATINSDIDILIDIGRLSGLYQLAGFMMDLEKNLKAPVDVVTTDSDKPLFLQEIQKDEVLIYENIG